MIRSADTKSCVALKNHKEANSRVGAAGVSNSRIWTVSFVNILLITVIVNTAHQAHLTTLPMYMQELSGSDMLSGLITGVFTIAALFSRPVMGYLIDRSSKPKILLAGILLIGLCSLSYSITTMIWCLILFRMIQGFGFSAYSTTIVTLVSDTVPEERLADGIGYYGVATSMAQAIAPVIAIGLMDAVGYQNMYAATALCAAIAIVLYGLGQRADQKNRLGRHRDEQKEEWNEGRRAEKDRTQKAFNNAILLPIFVMFLVAMAQGSISSFLAIYGRSKGVANISLYFTINATFLLLSKLWSGRLVAKKGLRFVILSGIVMIIGALLILTGAGTIQAFLTAGAIYGVGYGLVMPCINTLVLRMSLKNQRGMGNALFYGAIDAGYGVGSILWGIVATAAGYSMIYAAAAVCVFCGFLIYFVKLRN